MTRIPSEQDIFNASLTNPTVFAILSLWRYTEHIESFNDAMRICVIELMKENSRLNKLLIDTVSRSPIPIWMPCTP